MLNKVSGFIVKARWGILLFFIAALAVSFWAMGQVNVNYNLAEYLSDDSDTAISMDIMDEEFGLSGQAEIMINNVTVEEANDIKNRIAGLDNVDRVTFLNNGMYFSDIDGDGIGSALFKIIINGYDYSENAENLIADLQEEFALYDYTLSGQALNNLQLKERLSTEMVIMMLLGVLIVAVVLFLTSTSWFEPVIFGLTIGFSILINLGTNIFIGETSYIVRSIAAILQMALSMDYAIVTIHNYNEERLINLTPQDAMIKALARSLSPVSASALTTMAGLAAIMFMTYRIGLDIGLVLVKGIFISMMTVFTLMPGLMVIFNKPLEKLRHEPIRLFKKKTAEDGTAAPKKQKNTEGKKKKDYVWLLNKTKKLVPVATLILIVVSYFLQSNIVYAFVEGDKRGNMNAVKEEFGQSNQVIMITPLATDENGGFEKQRQMLDLLSRYNNANGEPILKDALSYVTTITLEVDASDASTLMGIDYDITSQLFGTYYLENGMIADEKIAFNDFLSFVVGLIEGDIVFAEGIDIAEMVGEQGSYIKLAEELLNSSGNAMTVKELTEYLKGLAEHGAPDLSGYSEYIALVYGLKYFDEKPLDMQKMTLKEFFNYLDGLASGKIKTDISLDEFLDEDTKEYISGFAKFLNTFEAELTADRFFDALSELAYLIGLDDVASYKNYLYFIYGNYGMSDPLYKGYRINIKEFVSYINKSVSDGNAVVDLDTVLEQEQKELIASLDALFKAVDRVGGVSASELYALLSDLLVMVPDFDLSEAYVTQLFGNYYYDMDENAALHSLNLKAFITYAEKVASSEEWSSLVSADMISQISGLRYFMLEAMEEDVTSAEFLAMLSEPNIQALLNGTTINATQINVIYALLTDYYNNYSANAYVATVEGSIDFAANTASMDGNNYVLTENSVFNGDSYITAAPDTVVRINAADYYLTGGAFYAYVGTIDTTAQTATISGSNYTIDGTDIKDDSDAVVGTIDTTASTVTITGVATYSYGNGKVYATTAASTRDGEMVTVAGTSYLFRNNALYTAVGSISTYWGTVSISGNTYSYNLLGDIYSTKHLPETYYILESNVYSTDGTVGSMADGTLTIAGDRYVYTYPADSDIASLQLRTTVGSYTLTNLTIGAETYSRSIFTGTVTDGSGNNVGSIANNIVTFTNGNVYYMNTADSTLYTLTDVDGEINDTFIVIDTEIYAHSGGTVYALLDVGDYTDNTFNIDIYSYDITGDDVYLDGVKKGTFGGTQRSKVDIDYYRTNITVTNGIISDGFAVVSAAGHDTENKSFVLVDGQGQRTVYYYDSQNITTYPMGSGEYANWDLTEIIEKLYINTSDFYSFIGEVAPDLMGTQSSYWGLLSLLGNQTDYYNYKEMTGQVNALLTTVNAGTTINEGYMNLLYRLYYFTKNPTTNYDPEASATYTVTAHNLLEGQAKAENVIVFAAKLLNSDSKKTAYYDESIYNALVAEMVNASMAEMLIKVHEIYLEIKDETTLYTYDEISENINSWLTAFGSTSTLDKGLIRQLYIMNAVETGKNNIAASTDAYKIEGVAFVNYLIDVINDEEHIFAQFLSSMLEGTAATKAVLEDVLNMLIDDVTVYNYRALGTLISDYASMLDGVTFSGDFTEILKQAYILYFSDESYTGEKPQFLTAAINVNDIVEYIMSLTTEKSENYNDFITEFIGERITFIYSSLAMVQGIASNSNKEFSPETLCTYLGSVLEANGMDALLEEEQARLIYTFYAVNNNVIPVTTADAASYTVLSIAEYAKAMLDSSSNSYNALITDTVATMLTTRAAEDTDEEYAENKLAVIAAIGKAIDAVEDLVIMSKAGKTYTYQEIAKRINDAIKTIGSGALFTKTDLNKGKPLEFSIDEALIEQVFVKYLSLNGNMPQAKVEVETLVGFLVDVLTNNTVISGVVSEEQQGVLDNYIGQLDAGKAMFNGTEHSRIIYVLNLADGGDETFGFIDTIRNTANIVYGEEQTYLAGNSVSLRDIGSAFDIDRFITTVVSIIAILLVVMLIYRSLLLPVILIAIIQGAIWISFSMNAVMNTPMFFMTYIITTCIQMGATIDYGIIVSSNYMEKRKIVGKVAALRMALKKSLPPIATSGVVLTITGFVISQVSTSVAVSSIGGLLARGTIVSILLVLIVLPQLLLIFDKLLEKTTLKARFAPADLEEPIEEPLLIAEAAAYKQDAVIASAEEEDLDLMPFEKEDMAAEETAAPKTVFADSVEKTDEETEEKDGE